MKTYGKLCTASCIIYMLLYGAVAAYAQDYRGLVRTPQGSNGGARRVDILSGNKMPVERIRKDFAMRKEQGNWRKEAPHEHIKSLSNGLCPDGSSVLTLQLPATGGYTDLWNTAYYCEGRNAYWVDHGNGALVGTVSLWYGPFPLGMTDVETDEYRFELEALLGEYSGVERIFVIPLALGTTFSHVKKVSVYLKGTVQVGKGVSTDGLNRHFELPVKLQIKISDKFKPAIVSLQTPVAAFGTLKGDFKDERAFRVPLYNQKPRLDFLRDGTAELKFSWREDCVGCRFIETASIRIDEAFLVIEGIEDDK